MIHLLALILKALFVATATAVAVAVLNYEDLLSRLRRHKVHQKDIGILVREHLKNGNVRVISSVLSKRAFLIGPRTLRHKEEFEGQLDSKLKHLFTETDKVKVTL
jgi:hypothetical protein